MAKSKIPDAIERRHLIDRDLKPAQSLRYAEAYLEAGRDQVGKGFVQFDLMATLKDSSADTLAIVERLEKPLSRSDALGLEVAVARSVIEAQGGRIWTEAGTAGSLRVCMTLPTSAN